MARLNGDTWVGNEAAARVQRKDWGPCNQLAQELWTILSRHRDAEPESMELLQPDGSVITNNTTNVSNVDHVFNVVNETTTEQTGPDGEQTKSETTRWDRAIVPGRILDFVSASSGSSLYNADIYPYGLYVPGLLPDYDPRDEGTNKLRIDRVKVVQLDINSSEIIPSGTWTGVMRIVQTLITLENGALTIAPVQIGHFMQVPIWL